MRIVIQYFHSNLNMLFCLVKPNLLDTRNLNLSPGKYEQGNMNSALHTKE